MASLSMMLWPVNKYIWGHCGSGEHSALSRLIRSISLLYWLPHTKNTQNDDDTYNDGDTDGDGDYSEDTDEGDFGAFVSTTIN